MDPTNVLADVVAGDSWLLSGLILIGSYFLTLYAYERVKKFIQNRKTKD